MSVKYCSRDCQVHDREAHRLFCLASNNIKNLGKSVAVKDGHDQTKNDPLPENDTPQQTLSKTSFATLIHSYSR